MHPSTAAECRHVAHHTIVDRWSLCAAALICGVCALGAPSPVSAQALYEVVASFDGVFLNGISPGPLIEAQDGNLYGTTSGGGRFGGGTVFRSDAAGAITTLHHFSGFDGSAPVAGVIQTTDGRLYGTTAEGGAFSQGTIFRLDAAGTFTTLHHFSGGNFSGGDGSQPSILLLGSGGIFGVTQSTVFRLEPDGTVTTLHRFTPGVDGFFPNALIEAADGSLYGTTLNAGGTRDDATIFRLDASGTLRTLHRFDEADGNPADLIQADDGDFYGVTFGGSLFKINAAGTFTTLHRFADQGRASVLIQGRDGGFYGAGESAAAPHGFIFRFDPVGGLSTLHTFTGSDGNTEDAALLEASDGSLYGTAGAINPVFAHGGSLFKLDRVGAFTTLHLFVRGEGGASPRANVIEANDGRLYGTTSAGGASGFGTVFTIEPSSALRLLHSFDERDGAAPGAGLVQASDQVLYGTTRIGGGGLGTIFAIDLAGVLTTLHVFSPPPGPFTGSFPNGLIQARDGRLYGTGGSSIFSLPLGGPVTFFSVTGGPTAAALFQASDDAFYGTTSFGGEFGHGMVFSVAVPGSLPIPRHSFSDSDGRTPLARVIQGRDGSFYGTTSAGGTFDVGTVFRLAPAGTLTTLHHFAGRDGANPYAGLLEATDGRLYGTTRNGGAFGYGTIFTIDTTGARTTLHDFAGTDGAFPEADVIQASDGNLYGTTSAGGLSGGGVVFRFRPSTTQYFEIVARHSGQCLDVFGGALDDVAPVIQWTCHGGTNQQWRIEPGTNGAVRIIARHSGKALDIFSASTDDTAPAIQYSWHGGDNQQWTLEPISEGYVRIVARHSGKALDVTGASLADGAAVIQYTAHGGANQQWLLRSID